MAITVTWATKIINIPKADTTLIQSVPTEIRELDINILRLRLKDLEDDSEGMPFLDTHRHNTEVQLAGITYARVVEIINDYTVTFEDGQYAVNLFGANHNVGDVANVNQVSIRVNNSAGLISSPAIEFAAYEDGIVVDVTKTTSGTAFDIGTGANPVGNILDALQIVANVGVKKLKIIGDITFSTGHDISGFVIEGESFAKSLITVDSDAVVNGAEFEQCSLQGTLETDMVVNHCLVRDIAFFEGFFFECAFDGTVVLGGSSDTHIINCHDAAAVSSPTIDMGGSGRGLIVRNWWGGLVISNKTGADEIAIGASGSKVTLTNTVGGTGAIFVRILGGSFVNNSTATDIRPDIVNPDTISFRMFEEFIANHNTPGTFGAFVTTISTNILALQTRTNEVYGLQGANTAWSDIVETDNKITQYRVNRYDDNTLTGDILTRWLYTATYSGDTLTTLTRIVMFDLNPILGDNFTLTDNLIVT